MAEHTGLLAAVMDTVHDAIITINSRGIVQYSNKSTTKLLGYSREELVGNNIKMIMPGEYAREHDSYISNYHETGEKKVIGTSRRVTAQRKDGTRFPVELFVGEVDGEQQETFVGVLRDVTEQAAAEDSAKKYMVDLERSNKALDDFAYIASHDLKEPLRAIHNHARFLDLDFGEELPEDAMRRLNRIVDLTKRMEGLIHELLYYSRLGRVKLATEKVDVYELVKDIEERLQDLVAEHNVQIEVQDSIPPLFGHRPQLREVFHNLIVNGIRYNKSNPKRIQVCFHPEHEYDGKTLKNVYAVCDNGIGIEQEFFTDIFRIFRRLNSEQEFGAGTGAGLTFVKKIIENHNGVVWVQSEEGKGSTFLFSM